MKRKKTARSFGVTARSFRVTVVRPVSLSGVLGICVSLGVLLVALPLALPALDQSKTMTQYAHRIWGQEEGLFQPTIYSILQTRDGFLWLGTQDSLIRFDGLHFHEFRNGDSFLHGSLIRSLEEDRRGNLWVASIGSGLGRISPDGSLRQFTTGKDFPTDAAFCLASDPANGDVWACTNQGLVQVRGEHSRVFSTADGLPSNQVRSACRAPDGTLWVTGTDFVLSRSRGERFERAGNRDLPAGPITALACGGDGSVWLGSAAGLARIRGASIQRFDSRNGLPDDEVSSLEAAADGTLWVGTNNGISRLGGDDVSVYRVRDGLSHSLVLSLFTDREGTLWAGTKDGLDQFTDGPVTPYTANEGLSSNDAGPVLEDRAGQLWIGTLGRGLNFFDGRRFHVLTTRDGLIDNTVLSLALDGSGDLWVGTKAGLNRIRQGRVIAAYTRRQGLSGGEIRGLFADSQNVLWVGTNRGLDRLEGDRFVPAGVIGGVDSSGVVALSGGRTVRLFASFGRPVLYVLNGQSPALFPVDALHAIDCYFLDRERRTAWMGTLGSGLLRWKNGAVAHIRVKDGLYDNRIYSILRDNGANFWFASSKGIFRVSERDLDAVADGKERTLRSLPFTTGQLRFECQAGVQPAAYRTHDGRLWFSTTSGVVVVDPAHLQRNRVPPPVSITALVTNGVRFESRQQLRLKPWETNNVEIRYAALSFVSPQKVAFRYRLENYDKTWIDAGDRREAFYTKLPPGKFTFQVLARNADGVWSTHPATLSFAVEPRLYQRWWFWPLLAALIALVITAFVRMRIRRLRQRFSLVLAERNRIARELHDTLLQGLSGITMQLQAVWMRLPSSKEKQFLGEIIKDAGRCSTEARQSLWGLRSAAPSDSGFSEKLRRLVNQAVAEHEIRLVCEVDPVTLRDMPEVEFELLRIAQEAVSNTLKHANALCLSVSLRVADDLLVMRIEDDGVGFSRSQSQPFGHFGLRGIEERVAEIGAHLSFTSSPEQGTSVIVSVPVAGRIERESSADAFAEHQRV